MKKFSPITNDKICFQSHWERNETTCHGDSGGPLVCDVNGKAVFFGVTSSGIDVVDDKGRPLIPCYIREGFPNVFARIPHFLPWIKEHVVRNV